MPLLKRCIHKRLLLMAGFMSGLFIRFIFLVTLLAGLEAPAFAIPSDVKLVNGIAQLATSTKTVSKTELGKMKKALAVEVRKQVDEFASARDYPGWFNSENPKITQAIDQLLSQAITGNDTKTALLLATLNTVSGVYAEQAMAKASGYPLPKRAGGSKAANLSASVTVRGGGILAANLEQSEFFNEKGSIGTGNGVLDPGEWGTLSLTFENQGKNRLVSTSVYVESTSECLWIEKPGEEHQLMEMMPDGQSSIAFHVFRSRNCNANQYPSLRVRAHDTHEFSNPPIVFDYDLRGKGNSDKVGYGQLVGIELDGDDYGHSEPTSTRPLLPDTQVELVSSYMIPGKVPGTVEKTYQFPSFLQIEHTKARITLRPQAGKSMARFADDVDIQVPKASIFKPALDRLSQQYGWQKPEDARLLVAVDTVVRIGDTPGESSEGLAAYHTRHYFHLPVEWMPKLICSLDFKPKLDTKITQGETVSVTGQVSGLPDGALVTLTDPLGQPSDVVLTNGRFDSWYETKSLKAQAYKIELEVLSAEGEILCEKSRVFDVKAPPVAKAAPKPKPEPVTDLDWPTLVRIDAGIALPGAGPATRVSMGPHARLILGIDRRTQTLELYTGEDEDEDFFEDTDLFVTKTTGAAIGVGWNSGASTAGDQIVEFEPHLLGTIVNWNPYGETSELGVGVDIGASIIVRTQAVGGFFDVSWVSAQFPQEDLYDGPSGFKAMFGISIFPKDP